MYNVHEVLDIRLLFRCVSRPTILGQYFNADSDGDAEEATVKPAKPTSPAATGNKSVKSPAVAAAAIKPAKRGRKAVGRGRPPGGGRPRETDESSDSEVRPRQQYEQNEEDISRF